MSSDFVTRTELDDLLVQQRRKIERLDQQAAEARENIESFRNWSIIVGSRVSQCETWIVGLMPDEQRVCVTGGDVEPQPERESLERAGMDLELLEPLPDDDGTLPHVWRPGDRVFVVRLRRDPPPSSQAVSMWWLLAEAEERVQLYADRVLAGGPEFVSVGITSAIVAAVDVLANRITSIEAERQLRREDETPTPATPKTGSLVARPGEAWIV